MYNEQTERINQYVRCQKIFFKLYYLITLIPKNNSHNTTRKKSFDKYFTPFTVIQTSN